MKINNFVYLWYLLVGCLTAVLFIFGEIRNDSLIISKAIFILLLLVWLRVTGMITFKNLKGGE